MSNILRFDQFREGYIFENRTSYRENIGSLAYLESRFSSEYINEGFLGDSWETMKSGATNFWNGLTSTIKGESSPNWSTESVLHSIADLGGIFGDFIYPGVGAAIDIFHAGVYFVQSYLVDDPQKKDECFTFGIITLIFAVPFLNPLQWAFKPIAKKFPLLLKLIGKGAPEGALAGFLSKNKPIREFVEATTKNLDTVEKELNEQISSGGSKSWMRKFEDWLDKGIEKIPILKKIKDGIVDFFIRLKELALEPFRRLRNAINLGSKSNKLVKYGVKYPLKAFKYLSQNTIGRLYKSFMKKLPGFPRSKKIGMFDNLFEKFEKIQKNNKGYLKGANGTLMKAGNKSDFVLVKSLNKGTNKAQIVIKGGPSDDIMRKELQKFWGEKLEDHLAKNPGTKMTKKMKDAWINRQANGSFLKEVDKSDFVQTFYKQYENTLRFNAATFKPLAALYKFIMGPIFNSKDSEKGEQDVEEDEVGMAEAQELEKISEEEADELLTNLDGSASDILDGYDYTFNSMTEEEKASMADAVRNTEMPSESFNPSTLNINTVVWRILDENDSSIELPNDENLMYSDFSWPLSKFQTKNGIEETGILDRKTIEVLRSKTSNSEYLDYLSAYLQTLPQVDTESQEIEEDEDREIQDEKNKKTKSTKSEKRSERRKKIKSFGRFLSGQEN